MTEIFTVWSSTLDLWEGGTLFGSGRGQMREAKCEDELVWKDDSGFVMRIRMVFDVGLGDMRKERSFGHA